MKQVKSQKKIINNQSKINKQRKSSTSKNVYGATQKFIPIKCIRNGIIETTDGRYVKILEVLPINFSMQAASERNTIIWQFASWIKTAPVRLQFKVLTRKAESSGHIEAILHEIEQEDKTAAVIEDEIKSLEEPANPDAEKKLKNLKDEAKGYQNRKIHAKEYISLVERLSQQEALTRRFFIIFEYEPYEGQKSFDYSEIVKTINTVADQTKSLLSACGNEFVSHNDADENEAAAEILYTVLNRAECVKTPFHDHVQQVLMSEMAKRKLVFGRDNIPDIPDVNFIAPRRMDLSNRDYVYIDGTYYSFLMLAADGFPSKVYAGWLSSIVNFGDGVDIDLFAHKENKSNILSKLNVKLARNKGKLNVSSDTSNDYENVQDAIGAGYYIKNSMARNNEDFYYLNVLITITSDSIKDLDLKVRNVTNMLRAQDMNVFKCKWRQEQALKSSLPLGRLDKSLYNITKHNVMTYGLASTYLFTAYELCDSNGILYGVNSQNNSLCTVDNFNSKVYKNANMCLLGTAGGGKTFTMLTIAMRLRMRGKQCFIIAPLKGHEFRRSCNFLNGKFISICPGSEDCINVMDIRVSDNSSDIAIEGSSALKKNSLLAKKIQSLKAFFLLLIPDMKNVEEQMLDEALVKTYEHNGIVHDNNSLFTDESHTTLKEMPILGDLYNELLKNPKMERIASIINLLVNGSASNFNGHTNIDLNNKFIVFDLSDLTGRMIPVGMFIALDYIWSKVKEDRTVEKAVFIDETWQLIGAASNSYAAEFVLELFKTIRGYAGSAIAASQDLNDFFALEGGKYGKAIISNSSIKIIKYLEAAEAASVQEAMNLTENELRAVQRFNRTQGLFCANNNKVAVEFVASQLEKALITTDPHELKELKERGYENLLNCA